MTPSNRVNLAKLAVVVMAKPAIAGQVKTRLVPPYTPKQAANVHEAMLACVMRRLEVHLPGRWILAMDGAADQGSWEAVPQGPGDLGERIERVWRNLGGGPAAFFGVDSPDIPPHAFAAIGEALLNHDVAIGPVEDGGYWTLAAREVRPQLVRGIDWGSDSVYDQTLSAAAAAGVTIAALPRWHDVDDAADLDCLQQRLQQAEETPLRDLAHRLRVITQENKS